MAGGAYQPLALAIVLQVAFAGRTDQNVQELLRKHIDGTPYVLPGFGLPGIDGSF